MRKHDFDKNKSTFFSHLDGAPPALVGLIGHNQYKECAQDIYFFLQVKSIKQNIFIICHIDVKSN